MSLAQKIAEFASELPELLLLEAQRFPEVVQAVVAEYWHGKDNPNPLRRNTTKKLYKRSGALTRALVPGKTGNIYVKSATPDGVTLRFGIDPDVIKYARVHEYGGTFTITARQRGFFWYKFYSTKLPMWRYLALAKTYTIPKRPYLIPALKKVEKEYGQELVKKVLAKKILDLWVSTK